MNNVTGQLQSLAMLGGLVPLVVVVLSIWLAWWCLQEFRFDLFLKRPRSPQSKLLQILIAVVLGYEFAKFIIDYFDWSSSWSSALKGIRMWKG